MTKCGEAEEIHAMEREPPNQEMASSGRTLGFDETFALIKSVKASALSRGISLHPLSRISQFEQQLRCFGKIKIAELSQPGFDWHFFTEGNRDLTEIAFICDKLANAFPVELKRDLKPILGGARLPSSDAKTLARDKQFELYLAALFLHSGFTISLDEPDLRFQHQGAWYGIAAKRISSADQIARRVREGIAQLTKAGLRGLVALSLDRLVPGKSPRVVVPNVDALDQAGACIVMDVLRAHGPTIAPLLIHPNAVGLIVNCVVPAFMAGTAGHIGTTTALRIMPRPDDHGSVALTMSINDRLRGPT